MVDDHTAAYDGYTTGHFRYEPGTAEGRILVRVPGIEDLMTVAALLERAGARITSEYRTFAVEGSLSLPQVAALMELSVFKDGNSEGRQLNIWFESVSTVTEMHPEAWWGEQQAVQRSARA